MPAVPIHATRTASPPVSARPRRRAPRVAATAVAAGLLAAVAAPAASAQQPQGLPYTDIQGSPDAAAITFLTAEGVLNGYPGGTFKPDNLITRAEFTAAVVRLLGPKAQAAAQALSNIAPSFKDAKSIPTWAWGYVDYAQGAKLIQGYPDGTFRPEADITDVEAAAILIRAIGDVPYVSGSWPANYTVAAYNLDLTQGVTFYTNLPASRGDVAQMMYNAVLVAPTLQPGYQPGEAPSGPPFYLGGDGQQPLAWEGTVQGATASTITLANAQGQVVLNAPLAPSYYLLGASSPTTLVGAQVLVVENQQGQVDFIQVQHALQEQSGTLATSSVPTPTGYTRVTDWEVSSAAGYGLLLSNGTVIPVVSPNSSAGTNYYLNVPAGGVALDPHALVPGIGNLADGLSVQVVLNGAGQATAVYASGPTLVDGLVSAVNAQAGTLTVTTGPQDSQAVTVTVQPWTTVTLNGAASSLAALQKDDVVDVSLVGGGQGGDTNATLVAATRKTVTGTITGISTVSAGATTETQLTVGTSGGPTTTVVESPAFDAGGTSLSVGQSVTLVLDAQGEARLALPVTPEQDVVLVKQLLTTETTTGTFTQIAVDDHGQAVTYTLAPGVPTPPSPPASGYLAEVTVQPGTTTVTSIVPLTAFAPPAGTQLEVVSATAQGVLVAEVTSSGTATQYFYVSAASGGVAYSGTTYVPFTALAQGQVVSLWEAPNGQALGVVVG